MDPIDPERLPDVEPALPGALMQLSQRQRTVVLLTHGYAWTQHEIADLLGISRSAVRNHLERAMTALRDELGGVE